MLYGRNPMTGSVSGPEVPGGWDTTWRLAGLAEGMACGAGAYDPRRGCCRGVGRDVHWADGSRCSGVRGAGSRDPGCGRDLVVCARGGGRAAVWLVGEGLSGIAPVLRRDPAAG